MSLRALARLDDIEDAIGQLDKLIADRTFEEYEADRVASAAFERFLEIISEASRHIPDAWKDRHPEVPWRRVADLGNRLRHAYHRIDLRLLWDLQADGLPRLKAASGAIRSNFATE